jgi:Flp pilus assembly protein TadG
MMRLRPTLFRRFAKSTRGIAAVEFAMVVPVLATIFLATFDGGRAIAVYMKVRAASYTLGAITNQYATIHDVDMTGIFNAVTDVLVPYPTSGVLGLTISGITIDATGKATVSWSSTQGGTARAVGAITVPTNLATPNGYLLLSEVKYSYAPLFGYFGNGATIALSDSIYVTPRSTSSVTRVSP